MHCDGDLVQPKSKQANKKEAPPPPAKKKKTHIYPLPSLFVTHTMPVPVIDILEGLCVNFLSGTLVGIPGQVGSEINRKYLIICFLSNSAGYCIDRPAVTF